MWIRIPCWWSMHSQSEPHMSIFSFLQLWFRARTRVRQVALETSVCLLGLIRVVLIYNDVFLFRLYLGQISSLCASFFLFNIYFPFV